MYLYFLQQWIEINLLQSFKILQNLAADLGPVYEGIIFEKIIKCIAASVTRFGKISPLWQNVKSLWKINDLL